MKTKTKATIYLLTLFSLITFTWFTVVGETQQNVPNDKPKDTRQTQTKETQSAMTPQKALKLLKEGNERYVNNISMNRDQRGQVLETSGGQYPFASILSCQDSRTSSELMFDLNNGDAFSIRIAGNIVNEDILGGLEFGTKVAGSKLIAIIGHTKCGAIYGACDNVKLGNLTGLLDKIKPAIDTVPDSIQPRNSKNPQFLEMVTEANVRVAMKQLRDESPILREMIDKGEIGLVGGLYNISTGKVTFFE